MGIVNKLHASKYFFANFSDVCLIKWANIYVIVSIIQLGLIVNVAKRFTLIDLGDEPLQQVLINALVRHYVTKFRKKVKNFSLLFFKKLFRFIIMKIIEHSR